jgi:hypothetical protein
MAQLGMHAKVVYLCLAASSCAQAALTDCAQSSMSHAAIPCDYFRRFTQLYVQSSSCPAHQHIVAPHAAATAAVAAVGAADLLGYSSLKRHVKASRNVKANTRTGTQLGRLLLQCVVTRQSPRARNCVFRTNKAMLQTKSKQWIKETKLTCRVHL